MRLLLVGGFAYPHLQGTQVYFQEQAIALRAAGAQVHLLSYGSPAFAGEAEHEPDRWRALDGFDHTTIPAWAAPASRRSGPQLAKPLADVALALALRRLVAGGRSPARSPARPNGRPRAETASSPASRTADPSASSAASCAASSGGRSSADARESEAPFDAILAHHAEAALAAHFALSAVPQGPPIVYCAHTLLEHELPSYLARPIGPRTAAIACAGRMLDRAVARRADGWIALTQSAERVMSASSPRPGHRIPPPVEDPGRDPERADPAAVASAHGLAPGRFFLYSGNLDPYQDLALLDALGEARARRSRRARGEATGSDFPIVVATHDERVDRRARTDDEDGTRRVRGVCRLHVRSPAEMQALFAAARASLVTRRSLGGFPIKLVNGLAMGAPAVAFQAEEWGLRDGHDSLICDPARPAESLVAALDRLERDDALAARLSAGARATWRAQHAPETVAARTLDLIASVIAER